MCCIGARGSHEHSGHSKTSKESIYYKTIEHKGNSPQKRRIHVITIKKARDDIESGCSSYQVLKFMSSLINQHNLYYHYKDDVFIKGCMHQRKRGPCHEGHTRYYFDLDSIILNLTDLFDNRSDLEYHSAVYITGIHVDVEQ